MHKLYLKRNLSVATKANVALNIKNTMKIQILIRMWNLHAYQIIH